MYFSYIVCQIYFILQKDLPSTAQLFSGWKEHPMFNLSDKAFMKCCNNEPCIKYLKDISIQKHQMGPKKATCTAIIVYSLHLEYMSFVQIPCHVELQSVTTICEYTVYKKGIYKRKYQTLNVLGPNLLTETLINDHHHIDFIAKIVKVISPIYFCQLGWVMINRVCIKLAKLYTETSCTGTSISKYIDVSIHTIIDEWDVEKLISFLNYLVINKNKRLKILVKGTKSPCALFTHRKDPEALNVIIWEKKDIHNCQNLNVSLAICQPKILSNCFNKKHIRIFHEL